MCGLGSGEISLEFEGLGRRARDLLSPSRLYVWLQHFYWGKCAFSPMRIFPNKRATGLGVSAVPLRCPILVKQRSLSSRYWANIGHVTPLRPDFGLGFQAKVLEILKRVPSSLGRGKP